MAQRRLIGTITSVKMHNTALVTVSRMKVHSLYGKRFTRSTTFAAETTGIMYQVGDVVVIEEHRPISKTKHWIIRERVSAGAPPAVLVETEVAAIEQALEATDAPAAASAE